MCACNKFGESVVHMACRWSSFQVVDFIMRHGGSDWFVDDFGRTPLHYACWRSEPSFDVVTLLLDMSPRLLLVSDARNTQPLHYVRDQDWPKWCAFLFLQRDRCWPSRGIK
jgi:ankyrin repeat protein